MKWLRNTAGLVHLRRFRLTRNRKQRKKKIGERREELTDYTTICLYKLATLEIWATKKRFAPHDLRGTVSKLWVDRLYFYNNLIDQWEHTNPYKPKRRRFALRHHWFPGGIRETSSFFSEDPRTNAVDTRLVAYPIRICALMQSRVPPAWCSSVPQ